MTFEKILHDARRAVSFYVDAQGLLAAGWNTPYKAPFPNTVSEEETVIYTNIIVL